MLLLVQNYFKVLNKRTLLSLSLVFALNLNICAQQQVPIINHIVLQEDIAKGERVREFKLEAEINGKWTAIYCGSSIGHKHIVPIDPVLTDKIRFVALSSKGEPQLKSMSVYKIDPPR